MTTVLTSTLALNAAAIDPKTVDRRRSKGKARARFLLHSYRFSLTYHVSFCLFAFALASVFRCFSFFLFCLVSLLVALLTHRLKLLQLLPRLVRFHLLTACHNLQRYHRTADHQWYNRLPSGDLKKGLPVESSLQFSRPTVTLMIS